MASVVRIEFTQLPSVNSVLLLKPGYTNDLKETFKAQRAASYQSTIFEDTFFTSQFYQNAFIADYNVSGIFTTSFINPNIIEIEHPDENFFIIGDIFISNPSEINIISVVDTPTVIPASLELIDYNQDSSNFCTDALGNVTANGGNDLYHVYELPSLTQVLTGQSSPLAIPTLRGVSKTFRVTDTTGFFIGEIQLDAPRQLIDADISLSVTNNITSSTITISVVFISEDIQPLTYSLDDITYQESNIFSGLLPGTYTVYVLDDFGCKISKGSIVIDGVTTVTETVFSISEINALRFSKIESGKKNHKNTLSCNELKKVAYPFFHRYLESDIITTQFKTNAQYINIYGIEGDGTQHPITESIKTSNVGLVAKSTCTYFNLGSGRSAIYFGVVDILDPVTSAFIQETNFGFILPIWANTKGQSVDISGIGTVPIDSIGYSDTYKSFVAEFNISYTGLAEERTLLAQYNLQPYEVYEFSFSMAAFPELFNIVIEVGVDSNNISETHISEKVRRVEDSDDLLEVVYYDVENLGGMVYQTGIQHKMLLEGLIDNEGEQETEGYNGDTDFFVTDNIVYDTQMFEFYRLSSEMITKLRLVSTHEFLIINGLSYKIAQAPEIKKSKFNNSRTFSVLLKRGGDSVLSSPQEILSGSGDAIAGAVEASQGKALVLWTKTNG